MDTERGIGIGIGSLGLGIGALLPLFVVVFPALGLTPDTAGRPEVVLPILAANPGLPIGLGAVEAVLHAIGGAAFVALWVRWDGARSGLLSASTAGVATWMAVDVVLNAIGMHVVPALAEAWVQGDVTAGPVYLLVSRATDAARFAAHFAGGLGLVGVSAYAWRTGRLPRAVAGAGVPVGALLAAHLVAPPLLFASVLTLPPWLVVLGALVARRSG